MAIWKPNFMWDSIEQKIQSTNIKWDALNNYKPKVWDVLVLDVDRWAPAWETWHTMLVSEILEDWSVVVTDSNRANDHKIRSTVLPAWFNWANLEIEWLWFSELKWVYSWATELNMKYLNSIKQKINAVKQDTWLDIMDPSTFWVIKASIESKSLQKTAKDRWINYNNLKRVVKEYEWIIYSPDFQNMTDEIKKYIPSKEKDNIWEQVRLDGRLFWIYLNSTWTPEEKARKMFNDKFQFNVPKTVNINGVNHWVNEDNIKSLIKNRLEVNDKWWTALFWNIADDISISPEKW
jgi:hypothetical protein